VVHAAFLDDANNLKSPPQAFYAHLCEHRQDFQGIVFLTEMERRDFLKKYPDVNRWDTFAISHPYPYAIEPADFQQRDKNKAVIVSRYDRIKRLDYAIDIFKLVTDQLPEVSLEIYGFGDKKLESEYREQIKRLGLEEKVLLKGFTSDAAGVFRGAACSIMTSYAEGYGLTIMESICNGCPAFAFDIKYGPADIIDDGKTGYLIPFKDFDGYAEQLIAFFQDEDRQREMSANAYAAAPRFGKEAFLERWGNFMERMARK
jgi:poly(glycerol-phosphate) alpha-glucosyltransferase